MTENLHIVILAAGQGTRMCSDKPKVLHTVAGKPLLWHVLNTVVTLKPAAIHIICGVGSDQLQKAFADYPFKLNWIYQAEQRGTADALKHALPSLTDNDTVLTLLGDMPLISRDSLTALLATQQRPNHIGVLSANVADPTGLGRIVRDKECRYIRAIVEEKDIETAEFEGISTQQIRDTSEINTGVIVAPAALLQQYLPKISNENAQQEYLLTDLIALVHSDNGVIIPVSCQQAWQASGVNTRAQLAEVERHYQRQQAQLLLQQGATLIDPDRIDIRGSVTVGRDVTIDVNTVFEGDVVLGDNCYVGPNTIIRNSQLGRHAQVQSHSVIDGAVIGDAASVGPFVRIRPDTTLGEQAHIGNFVELKNVTLGKHSKAGHLTYLGDSTIGDKTNIGAGTITCNYDGANKFTTEIGDDVFIGSGTLLRAPVSIGNGATTGAGAVIRHDVKANQLSITWQEQRNKDGWARAQKQANKDRQE